MRRLRLVVVGTATANPYAGLAWMHMQIVLGLLRLNHDVYYFETASNWPYHPIQETDVGVSDYALPYLKSLARDFGLEGRWAYRRSYSDKEWFGLSKDKAEDLLSSADAVINVTGTTRFAEEGLKVGPLVYLGTDPVAHEIAYLNGDPKIRALIAEHDLVATYGENIGTQRSPVPPLPKLKACTRQPVVLDFWEAGPATADAFTTVCNWHGRGEVEFRGETYYWSKDREFLKFIDLPRRIDQPVELAMGLRYISDGTMAMLREQGWRLTDAHALSWSPWPYRDYVCASRGEFTVAKDQNVRLRSGWFSERSACYLAAGRPVITQNTGFADVLPTGEGLFAYDGMEEILAAFEAIRSDYPRHAKAARAIAEDYFRAETVLAKLLLDLGL